MSLFETLTKVAIGIVVAKATQNVASRGSGRNAPKTASPRRTTTKTRAGAVPTQGPDPSDMGGIMDEILGAGHTKPRKTTAGTRGLGEVLGRRKSTSRPRKTTPNDGIADLLSGRTANGLGDLLAVVLEDRAIGGGISAGMGRGTSAPVSDATDEAVAAILLRAMIQAAKADGKLDAGEKERLIAAMGNATSANIDFVNHELQRPVTLDDLLADVPRDIEEKVDTVSVLAITLDQRAEAEYLHPVAQALGLEPDEVNEIHTALRVPLIYGEPMGGSALA